MEEKGTRSARSIKTLNKLVQKLVQDPNSCPEEWSSTCCRISNTALQKLSYYDSRAWVPTEMKEAGVFGDDLDKLGSVWYMRGSPYSLRITNMSWVFDGLGRFVIGAKACNCVALMWPLQSVLEVGVDGHEVMSWMENLDDSEFRGWSRNIVHCPLVGDGVVWVPYGWCCALVSFPNGDTIRPSFAVTMAVVSKKLAQQVNAQARELIAGHLRKSPSQG